MGARVLFVDDSEQILRLVPDGLRRHGFEVTCADSGVAARALLDAGGAFDAVVSDVSMPHGVSGIDLAEHVRATARDTRIVLASGYGLSQLPQLPQGVLFLHKPYRVRTLVGYLTQALLQD